MSKTSTNIETPATGAPPELSALPDPAHIEEFIASQDQKKKAEHKETFEQEAEAAWEESERQRKVEFLRKYRYDHWMPYSSPYKDRPVEEIYRRLLPKEIRLEALLKVGKKEFYQEALRCYLYRNEGSASIAKVRELFAPYIPVTGSEVIYLKEGNTKTLLDNLSPELLSIVRSFDLLSPGTVSWVVDWKIKPMGGSHATVSGMLPAGFQDTYPIFAHQQPNSYPPKNW